MKEAFRVQEILQCELGFPMGRHLDAVVTNLHALMIEAAEATQKLNWKPWRVTDHEVDEYQVLDELCDIQQFLINAIVELGFTYEDFIRALEDKQSNARLRYVHKK